MPISSFDWNSSAASQEIVELAKTEHARAGRITNMKGVLLHSAPAFNLFAAVLPLKQSLQKRLGARAVDIFSLAISEDAQCLLCSLYFRRALKAHGVDPDSYVPTEDEAALIEIGHRIAAEPVSHDAAPPEGLKTLEARHGAETVVEVVAYGSAMLATNRLNTTLGIPIDEDLLTAADVAGLASKASAA